MPQLSGALALGAVLAANDPRSTRIVYAMVAGLALLGVAFALLGIWLIRRTRVDPPVLAPLERMGERSWQRCDPTTQRRLLDQVRPAGAMPLVRQSAPPSMLADFDKMAPPSSFTDLGPGVPGDGRSPVVAVVADDAVAAHDGDRPTGESAAVPTTADGPPDADPAETAADDAPAAAPALAPPHAEDPSVVEGDPTPVGPADDEPAPRLHW